MKASPLIAAALIFTAGCATAPLTEKEQAVRILRHSDPEKGCKELGKIHSPGNMGLSSTEQVEAGLKREAAALGGNVATIDKTPDENGTLFGTAYACP